MLDYLAGGDAAPAGGPLVALAVHAAPGRRLAARGPRDRRAGCGGASARADRRRPGGVGLCGRAAPSESALAWLVGILAWSTVALAFAAPSLQRVVAGLPNDHYHAFLDPIVVILLAVPVAALLERAPRGLAQAPAHRRRRPARRGLVGRRGSALVAGCRREAAARRPGRRLARGAGAPASGSSRAAGGATGRDRRAARTSSSRTAIGFPIVMPAGALPAESARPRPASWSSATGCSRARSARRAAVPPRMPVHARRGLRRSPIRVPRASRARPDSLVDRFDAVAAHVAISVYRCRS